MITITCEAQDVREMISNIESNAERLGRAEASANRVYELEDELRMVRQQLHDTVKPAPIPVPVLQIKSLIAAVARNEKISAIKEVRSMTGLGLKESKDLVEEVLGSIMNRAG